MNSPRDLETLKKLKVGTKVSIRIRRIDPKRRRVNMDLYSVLR
ncbi:MAG: hypothetical protein ACM3ZQ_01735 [Bacillota bacterium]